MKPKETNWRTPFEEFGPDELPVQIWRLRLNDLDGDRSEVLIPLTVQTEHHQARQYRFEADRHRHLGGRSLVRTFLARRYGCSPQELSITEGLHGKPRLAGVPENEEALMFNIAHAGNVVVAAFSRAHPVGIDVEPQGRDADMEALVQRVFTESERRHWQTLPPTRRSSFFFQVWTCKEAFLKATGHGLQRALHTVECRFESDTVVGLGDAEEHVPPSPETSAAQWEQCLFSAADGVIGAVVRKRSLPSPLHFVDATRHVSQFSRSCRAKS